LQTSENRKANGDIALFEQRPAAIEWLKLSVSTL
jgi:hypothetical protein